MGDAFFLHPVEGCSLLPQKTFCAVQEGTKRDEQSSGLLAKQAHRRQQVVQERRNCSVEAELNERGSKFLSSFFDGKEFAYDVLRTQGLACGARFS